MQAYSSSFAFPCFLNVVRWTNKQFVVGHSGIYFYPMNPIKFMIVIRFSKKSLVKELTFCEIGRNEGLQLLDSNDPSSDLFVRKAINEQ